MDGGKHTMITYIKRKQNGYINFIKNKLQVRKIIRDKEGYYIMIKRFILKDYIAILKICLTKNRELNYMRQKLIELQGGIVK